MIHIFDESTPFTAKDLRKYQLYSALRKEHGKFLKSIKPGWYGEWVIYKKLIDAGGLGDTVYIVPARANNKVHTQLELYKELFAKGKEIKVVRLEDQQRVRTKPAPVPDFDLFTPEHKKLVDEFIDSIRKAQTELKNKPAYDQYSFFTDYYALSDDYYIEPNAMWLKQYPHWTYKYVRDHEKGE